MLKEKGLAYELEISRLFFEKPSREIELILEENIRLQNEINCCNEKWTKVKNYIYKNKVPMTIGGKKKYIIVTELLLNTISYLDRNIKLNSGN